MPFRRALAKVVSSLTPLSSRHQLDPVPQILNLRVRCAMLMMSVVSDRNDDVRAAVARSASRGNCPQGRQRDRPAAHARERADDPL